MNVPDRVEATGVDRGGAQERRRRTPAAGSDWPEVGSAPPRLPAYMTPGHRGEQAETMNEPHRMRVTCSRSGATTLRPRPTNSRRRPSGVNSKM